MAKKKKGKKGSSLGGGKGKADSGKKVLAKKLLCPFCQRKGVDREVPPTTFNWKGKGTHLARRR